MSKPRKATRRLQKEHPTITDFLPVGTKVEITNSDRSDINLGDVGEINETLLIGYAVAITKTYPQIVSHIASTHETRICFFKRNQFKLCHEAN